MHLFNYALGVQTFSISMENDDVSTSGLIGHGTDNLFPAQRRIRVVRYHVPQDKAQTQFIAKPARQVIVLAKGWPKEDSPPAKMFVQQRHGCLNLLALAMSIHLQKMPMKIAMGAEVKERHLQQFS